MTLDFSGKTALVAGAAGGIGFAVAKAFAQSGAKVALADINDEALKAAVQSLQDDGFDAFGMWCDVAQETAVEAFVQKTVERFGTLDVAYNNVGIQAPVAKITEARGEDFDRVLSVNLRGMWNCLKHELLVMEKQGTGGAIVNCSSQCGIVETPGLGAFSVGQIMPLDGGYSAM